MISLEETTVVTGNDPVNHPNHYQLAPGVEVLDVVRHLSFNRGNAVKYICRAGKKDPSKEIEDLKKAIFYLDDEIRRLERKSKKKDMSKEIEDLKKGKAYIEKEIRMLTEWEETPA